MLEAKNKFEPATKTIVTSKQRSQCQQQLYQNSQTGLFGQIGQNAQTLAVVEKRIDRKFFLKNFLAGII